MSPLVRLQLAGKGGEGTMDAGPSHSRLCVFRVPAHGTVLLTNEYGLWVDAFSPPPL